jgi:putative addiction module component (TIGR02574 family)
MTTGIDITNLTAAERILLVQKLWDSLAPAQASQPLTPAQQQEIERRLAAADRGEVSYSSWEDVKNRILLRG